LHTNFAYKFCIPIVQGDGRRISGRILRHVAMMPQDRDSLFEPPLPRLRKTSVIFESPLKITRKRKEDLFSPDRPTKRCKTYEFVDSAHCTQSTTRKRSKKPSKPRKKKDVDVVFFGDGGGFADGDGDYNGGGDYNNSPTRRNGVKDSINWSVTGEEVEMLKAKVVPIYWESLLGSPNGVIQMTKRLYILRDWDRSGFLMVRPQYIRLICLGSAV
jgi:hypothetical protein